MADTAAAMAGARSFDWVDVLPAVVGAPGTRNSRALASRQTGGRARTQINRPLHLSGGWGDPDLDIQTGRCGGVDVCVEGKFAELPAEQTVRPGPRQASRCAVSAGGIIQVSTVLQIA